MTFFRGSAAALLCALLCGAQAADYEPAAAPAGMEDDSSQVLIQEPDEDVAGFIEDYIRKEIELKKYFFVPDPVSGAALTLEYEKINTRSVTAQDGSRVFEASFAAPATKKKYRLLFHVQGSQWGGLDIFRIEVRPVSPAPPAKK